MTELKRLSDCFPTGTFTGFLASMTDAPWASGEYAASSDDIERLDVLYVFQHSGDKYVVPLMKMFLDENGKLTETSLPEAADMALALWKKKWTALWEVNNAEYDPIENYRMTEHEEEVPTGTEQVSTSNSGTNSSRTTGAAADNVTTGSVYGFNSTDPVPANKSEQKSDWSVAGSNSGSGTETKSFTNRKDTRDLTRSGNIGVTTSQQMLQSSIELQRWNFWLQVFEDLDATFCLDCY